MAPQQQTGPGGRGRIAIHLLCVASWCVPGVLCAQAKGSQFGYPGAQPAAIVASACCALLLTLFFERVWIALLLATPLVILNVLDVHTSSSFGTLISPGTLEVVRETTWQEAKAYLGAIRPWAITAAVSLVVAQLAAAVALWRLDYRLPLRPRLAAAALLASLAGGLFLVEHRRHQPMFTSMSFVGLAARLYQHERQHLEEARVIAGRQGRSLSFTRSAEPPGDQLVVLVLGESSRLANWSLAGYSRPTNPRLAALPGLTFLPRVRACAALTHLAVPLLLTGVPPEESGRVASAPSIVAAFKAGGFATAWISNQGANAGGGGSIIPSYAHEADEVTWLNIDDFATTFWDFAPEDRAMLPPLQKLLDRRLHRLFVVLHTMGSHFTYETRYPPADAFFQPAFSRQEPSDYAADRERMINSYDNSIRYVDGMLADLIGAIDRSWKGSAMVLFTSDHGENLLDTPEQRLGHGVWRTATPYELEIPTFFWGNGAFLEEGRPQIERIAAARATPVGCDALAPTLLDLAGLSVSGFDSAKSLASPRFQPPRALAYVTSFGDALPY